MATENLPEGMSREEVRTLLAPRRSYGTCDVVMSDPHTEVNNTATRDPKPTASTSASPSSCEDAGRTSERAKREGRRRSSRTRSEERKTRESKCKQSLSSPKRTSDTSTKERNKKKGIHCTEIFLTRIHSNFNRTFREMPQVWKARTPQVRVQESSAEKN